MLLFKIVYIDGKMIGSKLGGVDAIKIWLNKIYGYGFFN